MIDPLTAKALSVSNAAPGLFAFQLCRALVAKGVFDKTEAAAVMTATANDIRSGSEDGAAAGFGETMASVYEKFAGWLLGVPLQGPGRRP